MNLNSRADLFGQLAVMEEAGLPFDRMLDAVHLPRNEYPRLRATRKWARLGVGVAEAGRKGGLFTPWEASLVRAATLSGSPARTYRLLADQCARRAARAKALKSRMIVPAMIFAIAIMLGPLPGLIGGTVTVTGYLAKSLLPLIGLGIAVYLLLELRRRRRLDSRPALGIPLDGILPFVPMFGPIEVRRNLRDFLDGMALLLDAGVPMLDAIPVALETVGNHALRRRLSGIKPLIEGGATFAQALGEVPLLVRTHARELIRTGEASGTLPRMLFRYTEAETAAINRFDDLVAEWLPRLAYTAAAVFVGYCMIRSGAFMPSLPQALR